MLSISKKCLWLCLFLIMILLSGCSIFKSPAEKIYDILENVVEKEQVFADQQGLIVDLEKKEKEVFEEMIQLGMKEQEKIVELSNKAINLVEERKSNIEIEHDSIQEARKEFEKMEPLIEKLENKKAEKYAKKLYQTMTKRYDAYDELYANYVKGLSLDKELYNMFQKEDLTIDELDKKINEINETYGKVLKYNDEFNEQTEKYNQLKRKFYQATGLQLDENEEKGEEKSSS